MIPEVSPVYTYAGNGVTTTFDFNCYIENENQLDVFHTDKNGTQVKLVYDTDYTINEIGNKDGSYIKFPKAGSSYPILQGETSQGANDAEKITLSLTLPISQESEYGTSSMLDLKSIEYSLDYLTRLIQIQARISERSVKVQEGSANTPDELINSLNQAQITAQSFAHTAELKAIDAQDSANDAAVQAANATQQAAIVEETYNTAMSNISTSKQDALNSIEKAQSTAENVIATGRENIASDLSAATDNMNITKTNLVNSIQALGMFMEEDRLFYFTPDGIKHEFRNDYGGIAPMAIKHKEIKKVENGFELSWTDPDDSIYQNNVYCSWGNTLILRKENAFPESPFDGEIVVNSNIRNQYSETPFFDEVDSSKDFKYRAFPCSINKVFSLDNFNKFGVWIYSYKRVTNESVPSKKIEYYGTNEHYQNAYMNFTSDTFNYGDWKDAPFLLKDRLAPCMVNFGGDNNGIVSYFLNPDNYAQKENGSASDVSNTASTLNAMMRFKLLYRRRRVINGDEYIDISNEKVSDDFKPYGGFVKPDGTLREYIYLPIYRGSLISGKCRSIGGSQTPMSSQTALNERTYCQANGGGWDMITYADKQMIEDLSILMFKTTDFQSALGQGKSNGGTDVNACLKSGTMDAKGLFYGSTSTAVGIKLFGMENRYASQWERILGHVQVNGVQKVKLSQGTSDGSTVDDFNFTGDGYITLSELPVLSGSSGGYISKSQPVENIGNFPVIVSGSSSTYECDGMWFNNSGTMVAIRGGDSANGAICGLFTANLNNPASNAYWNIGSSVSYKPL